MCDKCEGSGNMKIFVKCRGCNGTGKKQNEETDCTKCDGHGTNKCLRCNGKGWIYKDENERTTH